MTKGLNIAVHRKLHRKGKEEPGGGKKEKIKTKGGEKGRELNNDIDFGAFAFASITARPRLYQIIALSLAAIR